MSSASFITHKGAMRRTPLSSRRGLQRPAQGACGAIKEAPLRHGTGREGADLRRQLVAPQAPCGERCNPRRNERGVRRIAPFPRRGGAFSSRRSAGRDPADRTAAAAAAAASAARNNRDVAEIAPTRVKNERPSAFYSRMFSFATFLLRVLENAGEGVSEGHDGDGGGTEAGCGSCGGDSYPPAPLRRHRKRRSCPTPPPTSRGVYTPMAGNAMHALMAGNIMHALIQ